MPSEPWEIGITETEHLAAIAAIKQSKALYCRGVDLRGRAQWVSDGLARFGIISVHQGHQSDIVITGSDTSKAILAFIDHMFFPWAVRLPV